MTYLREDNIKMDLWEVGCDPEEWIDLNEDMDLWRAYVRAVMNNRVSWLFGKREPPGSR